MPEAVRATHEEERAEELARARFANGKIVESQPITHRTDDNTKGGKDHLNLKRHLSGVSSAYRRREGLKDMVNKSEEVKKFLPRGMREDLEDVRQKYKDSKKLLGQAKTLVVSAVTPWGIFSLISQINFFRDWTYGLALFAAIFKDILDVGLTTLQGATGVTVVLAFVAAAAWAFGSVISILTSIFIAMMMLLGNLIQPDEHDRTVFQSVVLKKWGVLGVVFIIETFFVGINIMPVQTIGVILIYLFALAERKGREDVLKKAS